MVEPRLIPARAAGDVRRLIRLLLAEPALAGRLRDPRPREAQENYSGAFMVDANWLEEPSGTPAPALVKVGASAAELRWARDLAGVDPGLMPTLHASGETVGGEPLRWLVMERCPHVLGWQWGAAGYAMLLEAGLRFQVAARRLSPVGPADVAADTFFARVRAGLACAPPPPGPAEAVAARLEQDWAWVLECCAVELCHGDLHAGNAVSRAAPPDPEARALLIDPTPAALPWAFEPAYCQIVYWPTPVPEGAPTLVHAMASLRARRGFPVPDSAEVDRLAALFLAWHALRLWPHERHRHHHPDYPEAVRRYVEAAAAVRADPGPRE